ncbi:hypothetical protein EQP59_08050 [Ornithobacterium rhinotracheale]|uniref:Uncharacterized protein n=1 Tax=Ornithobacterium rhinotracheale TaxID=28251 RepID=A0A410JSX7_ORNRH|nr:hypothetical protein [Ornithobacterium rhinotracheale]QAR31290.1 hypothetical protein EQP59_08050 [Ornithobacterium rhinotracheale]
MGEYTVYISRDLEELKKRLLQKAHDFSQSEKDYAGFYYLLEVIEQSPRWKYRNKNEFYTNLSWVVQEFPVKNNGKVCYGDYLSVLSDFQEYIKTEFGLLAPNKKFMNYFWRGGFLGFLLGVFFNIYLALAFSVFFAFLFGAREENKARQAGKVLGAQKPKLKFVYKNKKE